MYAMENSKVVSLDPGLTPAERWVVGAAAGMALLVALGSAVGTAFIIRARIRERRQATYQSIDELTRNELTNAELSFSRQQQPRASHELAAVTEP